VDVTDFIYGDDGALFPRALSRPPGILRPGLLAAGLKGRKNGESTGLL